MFLVTIVKYRQRSALVNLDYLVKIRTPGSTPRIICSKPETYRFFWPHLFSRSVPAIKSFAQWTASHGASVFPRIRLKMKPSGRCFLSATRFIKGGTALVSIPRYLCLEVNTISDERYSHSPVRCEEWYNMIADMASQLARHLHDPKSEYRPYVELLCDIHNIDSEGETCKEGVSTTTLHSLPYSAPTHPGNLSYLNQQALQQQLEAFYSGNVVHAKGVSNAPFLCRKSLETPFGRVEWRRLQRVLREVQQGVPHFAAPSVPWALSMVLSRSIRNQVSLGGPVMCPIIDFCEHSYIPNAALAFSYTQKENRKLGVLWHDSAVPCVHLRSVRDISRGEHISILFSSRPQALPEDRDYWRVYRGFIPKKASSLK